MPDENGNIFFEHSNRYIVYPQVLVVLPFFSGDKHQAVKLAKWINELDRNENHRCLLVIDFTTDTEGVWEPLAVSFNGNVEKLVPHYKDKVQWGKGDGSTTGDATCPNNMFRAAATWIQHKENCPWLWLEPDAVPLKKGWLDEIEEEYKQLGKPFMGDQVLWPNAPEHMSGVGVYPARVCDYSVLALRSGRGAFDVNAAHQIIKHAAYTNLIQHVWRFGGPGGQVPTFPTKESLNQIEEKAVIFHRCKDSTLIDRLRENLNKNTYETCKVCGGPTGQSSRICSSKCENKLSEVGAEAELRAARIAVPTPAQSYSATSVTVTVDGLGKQLEDHVDNINTASYRHDYNEFTKAEELKEKRRANMAKARAAKKAKAEAKKAKHDASFPPPDAFHKATGR